jgi:hypothetical protein
MGNKSTGKNLLFVAAIVVVGIIGYGLLYAPDQRTTGEKIVDAVDALPDGLDKAARQLEDRTPADKLKDAASDAGDDLKKATNQQ